MPALLARPLLTSTTTSSTTGAAAISTICDFNPTVYSLQLRNSIVESDTWSLY